MKKVKRKVSKRISILFLIVFIGIVSLNWFMTYRLEAFLNQILQERLSEATDGFYSLYFSKLNIGFFNGELLIEGIQLHPDSTVFKQRQQTDSLPDYFLNIDIGSIYFKGINLTWIHNYKTLNFELFEIKDADVKIYDSYYKQLTNEESDWSSSNLNLNLYEIISPYISSLGVKQMNLENASVSYWAKDVGTTAVYALKNVDFHTYGFKLDKNSHESGKLLYCDNFEFTAQEPQTILVNSSLIFKTDKIRFSTQDSIISIQKIKLYPPDSLWRSVAQRPTSYLNATVDSVNIRGLAFDRERAKVLMHIRSFNITSSDIQYFTSNQNNERQNKEKDSIDLSWSLYGLVSPIIQSVDINRIGIDSARLKYSVTDSNITDIYALDRFAFVANNFRIDSLSDIEKRLLYSDDFWVGANGISALMNSRNYKMGVKKMDLNTQKGNFRIDDVSIKPLKKSAGFNYIEGTLDYLNIDSLRYEKGLDAGKLEINKPKLDFVRVAKNNSRKPKSGIEDHLKNLEAFQPLIDHFFIKRIELNNASLSFKDRVTNGSYNLRDLNFYADSFRIDENTRENVDRFYAFINWGISFSDFNNLLAGDKYQLQIKKGSFRSEEGLLRLEKIELNPRIGQWAQTPPIYYKIKSPLILAEGLYFMNGKDTDSIASSVLRIDSPEISLFKEYKTTETKKEKKDEENPINISIGDLLSNNLNLRIYDKINRDSLHLSFEEFSLKAFKMNPDKVDLSHLDIGNLEFLKKNQTLTLSVKSDNIKLDAASMKLKPVDSSIKLGKGVLSAPVVSLVSSPNFRKRNDETAKKKGNIYESIGEIVEKIEINELNINEGALKLQSEGEDNKIRNNKFSNINLNLKDLYIDAKEKNFSLDNIDIVSKDLAIPLDDGFYTLNIDTLKVSKENLLIDKLYLKPEYSKTEFAHLHPKHKDWFDVKVNQIKLLEMDLPSYFKTNLFRAGKLTLYDTYFQNYKNQQIDITHNVMPLIYEGLQKLPLKLYIDSVNVANFNVVYEELAKKGTVPGKIFFTDMNGKIAGLTNFETLPLQTFKLNADGKLMGTGYFTADWIIPVSPDYDQFGLKAHLRQFDFRELNQLVTPLFPAKVKTGRLNDLRFDATASSKSAWIDMTLLYDNLEIELMKIDSGVYVTNNMQTKLANMIIRNNNPRNRKSKPKVVDSLYIERDPYHSTFNYFWQILRPPVLESVGVSRSAQNRAKSFSAFFTRLKNFMGFGEDYKKTLKKEGNK